MNKMKHSNLKIKYNKIYESVESYPPQEHPLLVLSQVKKSNCFPADFQFLLIKVEKLYSVRG